MADSAVGSFADLNPVHTKKGRSKKALKQKTPSENEANILAGKISSIPPSSSPLLPLAEDVIGKENQETHSSAKKTKPKSKAKASQNSFERELEAMKEKFEQMRLEKEKTEELLKDRDETLKQKDEVLEIKEKEQEKLKLEVKKLQKLKEFKPTMSLPLVQSLKEEQEKKNGKKKNPERKRPSPAYALWCKDQWVEVKKENPEAEFKDIGNILGTKWKNLSEEEKKPYEEKYQADKEAYLEIMGKEKREKEAMKLLEGEQKQKTAMELLDQYLQFKQEGEEVKEGKKKKKEQQDPLKPKRPLSAFFLFSKDIRAELLAEKKTIVEISKIAGEEWKNMSEAKRKPYEKIAKQQKEEYVEEMEVYKQKKEEEAAIHQMEVEEHMKIQKQEALQLLKKKEKTENIIKKTKEKQQQQKKKKKEETTNKKVVDPNKPKRPASSFILFSKEARKNLQGEKEQGMNNSTMNAMISVKWKELGEEEKKIWNDKASEAMDSYKKELEEYNNNKSMIAEKQPSVI